jgi:hypothetical protein
MLGILLTTIIFISVIFGLSKAMDIHEVKVNWAKYRCRPDVMLTASLYGHNASENLEYCLKNTFDGYAFGFTLPLYSFMGMFVNILVTLLSSINSIRMIFATIVGSFTKIFSEFSSRFKALFYTIQNSAFRIKFLMGRIFATMNAIIFMGMSGIKAGQNLGNTTLFKFLDFICFDPDTPVEIEGRGTIAIKDVVIGNVFKGKHRVTSLFRFWGDGQTMCKLGNCIVSTNHYVLYKNRWIHAADHPDAERIEPWAGGIERPLICFNTNTHTFPVGGYTFRDYDESDNGDLETMKYVMKCLNRGEEETTVKAGDYTTCCHPDTEILLEDGSTTPAKEIRLGERLSQGQVIGLIKKECTTCCWINGEAYGVGTTVWVDMERKWRRAADISPIVSCNPTIFISYMVSPGATIETKVGTLFRDYFEIHQPEMEDAYTNVLRGEPDSESHTVQTEC